MTNHHVFDSNIDLNVMYFPPNLYSMIYQSSDWRKWTVRGTPWQFDTANKEKNMWERKMSGVSPLVYLLCSLSYVGVCVSMTSLWTPQWKIHSPQECLYSVWRLMRAVEHMSNDVNSHLSRGSHYYHLHHGTTPRLIWSPNKLSQPTSTLCHALLLHNMYYIFKSALNERLSTVL